MLHRLLRTLAIKLGVTAIAAFFAVLGCQAIGTVFLHPGIAVTGAAAWTLVVFLVWASSMKAIT